MHVSYNRVWYILYKTQWTYAWVLYLTFNLLIVVAMQNIKQFLLYTFLVFSSPFLDNVLYVLDTCMVLSWLPVHFGKLYNHQRSMSSQYLSGISCLLSSSYCYHRQALMVRYTDICVTLFLRPTEGNQMAWLVTD